MRDQVDAESTATTGPPLWRCCWPTADETTLSFCCPLEDGPWLAGRALDTVRKGGGTLPDPGRERYATGGGSGAPLIVGEPLLWHGIPGVLEVCQVQGRATGEVTVRLPPWSELSLEVGEDKVWDLADRIAVELGAACAILSDGRAIGYPDLAAAERTARRLQLAHLGVIVPTSWLPFLRAGSNPYLLLPESELAVVLE